MGSSSRHSTLQGRAGFSQEGAESDCGSVSPAHSCRSKLPPREDLVPTTVVLGTAALYLMPSSWRDGLGGPEAEGSLQAVPALLMSQGCGLGPQGLRGDSSHTWSALLSAKEIFTPPHTRISARPQFLEGCWTRACSGRLPLPWQETPVPSPSQLWVKSLKLTGKPHSL